MIVFRAIEIKGIPSYLKVSLCLILKGVVGGSK